MKLIVIVNTQRVNITHRRDVMLAPAIDRAILLAGYRREDHQWQVRDRNGERVDERLRPKDLGLLEDATLYVTLPPGVGA